MRTSAARNAAQEAQREVANEDDHRRPDLEAKVAVAEDRPLDPRHDQDTRQRDDRDPCARPGEEGDRRDQPDHELG